MVPSKFPTTLLCRSCSEFANETSLDPLFVQAVNLTSAEVDALVILFNATGGPNWKNKAGTRGERVQGVLCCVKAIVQGG